VTYPKAACVPETGRHPQDSFCARQNEGEIKGANWGWPFRPPAEPAISRHRLTIANELAFRPEFRKMKTGRHTAN
jgi:hypothetical protein